MSKEARQFLPQILWYIAIWSVIASALFFLLRYRRSVLFSQEKYGALLTTVSEKRQKAVDPCQFFIWGDPPNAEGNFAKAIFYCTPDKKAVNSLDLSVLSTMSYKAMLNEVGRINGFSAEPVFNGGDWQCFSDREKITDFDAKIKLKSRVECFYHFNQAEIKKVYAEN